MRNLKSWLGAYSGPGKHPQSLRKLSKKDKKYTVLYDITQSIADIAQSLKIQILNAIQHLSTFLKIHLSLGKYSYKQLSGIYNQDFCENSIH